MQLGVGSASGCGDNANAVTWVNANFNSVSPLSLAWATQTSPWQYNWSGFMTDPSSTTPAGGDTSTNNSAFPCGEAEFPNSSIYAVGGGSGNVVRNAFLLPDSTAYIVGTWCSNAGCAIYYQQACKATGTAALCGYEFDLPIPDPSLCNTEYPYGPEYTLWPVTNYGSCFTDYTWGQFVTACEGDPSQCASGCLTPGDCALGDPFFGDPP